MKVIAVHGKAESGKTTFLNSVFKHYKKVNPEAKIKEINFADTLKEAVNLVFRIPMEDLYSTKGKQKYLKHFNTTVRDILQRFGTEGCRSIYKDIWVWNFLEKVKEADLEGYDIIGVSDLRFKNEYKALKDIGAICVKTIRKNHKGITLNGHQSEVDLDKIKDWDMICSAKNVKKVNKIAKKFTKRLL